MVGEEAGTLVVFFRGGRGLVLLVGWVFLSLMGPVA